MSGIADTADNGRDRARPLAAAVHPHGGMMTVTLKTQVYKVLFTTPSNATLVPNVFQLVSSSLRTKSSSQPAVMDIPTE